MAAADPRVKVILNSRNFGPFRSNFNALRYATGDAVLVFLPVDLQDPPELIPEMVRFWESGVEVVAGARANRDETWALRTCRRIFYRLVSTLSDFDVPENVGEFQLIDRRVWEVVVSHRDQYPFIRGIIASAGFKRLILPYTWRARKRGISKNNALRLIDQGMNGIFSFTSAPLRFGSFLGFGIASLSFLYAVVTILLGLFVPGLAPRGTLTVIVALFFFSGVQLMFIGMLGNISPPFTPRCGAARWWSSASASTSTRRRLRQFRDDLTTCTFSSLPPSRRRERPGILRRKYHSYQLLAAFTTPCCRQS